MIDVLFVDDDQTLLAGLRRMLYSMRSEWSMRFVDDPTTVSALLDEKPADVVVSDMRMPKMDGAALLTNVRERHPGIVRIILSGHTEMASALRSVPVAHRFLNKPCEPGELKSAIEGSFELHGRLQNPLLREMLCKVDTLPSPSSVVEALNEALLERDTSIEEIDRIVSSDVALTAKLLQLANSAFFGLAREVRTVSDAILCLGVATIRDLAATADVYRTFRSLEDSGDAPGIKWFEEHSQAVARAASTLMSDEREAQQAFSAGLLHDVGLLALAVNRPADFARVQAELAETSEPIDVVERRVLSTTHAELGAYLLTLWGLPYAIVEPVARHHDTNPSTSRYVDAMHAVKIAEALCTRQAPGWEGTNAELDDEYLAPFQLGDHMNMITKASPASE